jgi:hypothetical protein
LAGAMPALTKLQCAKDACSSGGLVKGRFYLHWHLINYRSLSHQIEDSLFVVVPVSSSRLQCPWLLSGHISHGQDISNINCWFHTVPAATSMNRYKTVPGLSSQQKATSNTTCQKCLKKDRTPFTIFVHFSAWLTSLYATTATSARQLLKSVHMSRGPQERSNYSIPNLRPNSQVMYLMIFYGSTWPQLILLKMYLFARPDLAN